MPSDQPLPHVAPPSSSDACLPRLAVSATKHSGSFSDHQDLFAIPKPRSSPNTEAGTRRRIPSVVSGLTEQDPCDLIFGSWPKAARYGPLRRDVRLTERGDDRLDFKAHATKAINNIPRISLIPIPIISTAQHYPLLYSRFFPPTVEHCPRHPKREKDLRHGNPMRVLPPLRLRLHRLRPWRCELSSTGVELRAPRGTRISNSPFASIACEQLGRGFQLTSYDGVLRVVWFGGAEEGL